MPPPLSTSPAGQATPRKADLIEGLLTGLAVINAFSDTTPTLTASALATRLGLSRAAARRFLITLQHAGYAASDGSSYWLTPRVLALGHSYTGSARLPRTVRPALESVTAAVRESSNFAVLDGDEVIYTERATVPRVINTVIEPGTRLPAHVTAAGRVILAALPAPDLETWLANARLGSYTSHTIVSRKALTALIRGAAREGYAAVESQFELGLRGIAVPLIDGRGVTLGAIGISMPVATEPMATSVQRCLPALKRAATELRNLL
ncbi:MAG: helix-turn-helix domain-containing protein [Burkholderiales bacterium]|nr:helix-turn-helix domain-containing protein [Burkholderiales bacterium]